MLSSLGMSHLPDMSEEVRLDWAILAFLILWNSGPFVILPCAVLFCYWLWKTIRLLREEEQPAEA